MPNGGPDYLALTGGLADFCGSVTPFKTAGEAGSIGEFCSR
jgi:hypothetical protein